MPTIVCITKRLHGRLRHAPQGLPYMNYSIGAVARTRRSSTELSVFEYHYEYTNVASQFSEQRPPVQAPLNYLAKRRKALLLYLHAAARRGADQPPHCATNGGYPRCADNRRPLSLDREGFALTQYESAVSNFYDETRCGPFTIPSAKSAEGRDPAPRRVVVFDHIVRWRP